MNCDVGETTEGLENEQPHPPTPSVCNVGEAQKGWRMRCYVGDATEGLENEQSLILQPLPSLHLRHSSFSNPSLASPTSQLILQRLCRFTYVTWRSAQHKNCIICLQLLFHNFVDLKDVLLEGNSLEDTNHNPAWLYLKINLLVKSVP